MLVNQPDFQVFVVKVQSSTVTLQAFNL